MAAPLGMDRFRESTRGRITTLLRRGEKTVDELAAALGVTDNAVRAQLTSLERDGLVRQTGLRRGVGKPAYTYGIAEGAEPLFSRLYAPVLVQLLRELAARYSGQELEDVMQAVGRRLAEETPAPGGTLASRLQAAGALLEELGGAVDVERRGDTWRIRGAACPLSAAARDHREVCVAVQTLLSTLLGTEVRERCDREDGARCCFEVGSEESR